LGRRAAPRTRRVRAHGTAAAAGRGRAERIRIDRHRHPAGLPASRAASLPQCQQGGLRERAPDSEHSDQSLRRTACAPANQSAAGGGPSKGRRALAWNQSGSAAEVPGDL